MVREATPLETASRVLSNVNLIAQQFIFRPLSQIGQHGQTFVFENSTQTVCGRPCVSLRYADPTFPQPNGNVTWTVNDVGCP